MDTPHFDVVICTPGASMVAPYVQSVLKTTNFLTSKNITWTLLNAYSSHVADARERTIGGPDFNNKNVRKPYGGQFTYRKLFWIDSDISWEPEDFMRLLQSGKQVISGAYKMDDAQIAAYDGPMSPPILVKDLQKYKNPFVVRAVGFGFLCISAGVFERMERPWFATVPVAFKNENTGETEFKYPLIGEDTAWCEKAYQMGIEIWLDPLVRPNHQKTIRLGWQ